MPPVEVPSDQVEELEDPAPGAALDLLQDERGNDAANAAAVDGENAHGVEGSRYNSLRCAP